jgi:hypothetical protein
MHNMPWCHISQIKIVSAYYLSRAAVRVQQCEQLCAAVHAAVCVCGSARGSGWQCV